MINNHTFAVYLTCKTSGGITHEKNGPAAFQRHCWSYLKRAVCRQINAGT